MACINFSSAVVLFFIINAIVVCQGKVLLFLLDGLRWDLYGQDLPELKAVEENGVRAEWMDGIFVTLSLPSSFSMVTGLYPESHGVIHNLYFDPEQPFERKQGLNVTEWFNQAGAEPIWVTAINQDLKAGSIKYPGANVAINGVEPTRRIINTEYPTKQGIDDAIAWLKDDDFDLLLLYSDEPDASLHKFGTDDPRTFETLMQVDGYVGYLFQKLESEGLDDITDVIMISDHGHVNLDPAKIISIYDYVDPEDVQLLVADYGPLFQLEPKEGKLEKLFQALDGAHPALHVFKKDDFPERFHYADNVRNLQIVGYADPNWDVYSNYSSGEYTILSAGHGFDNNDMIMKSSFFARGPSFKSGYRQTHFESVNCYMIMCDLLGLQPAPNNGSRANYEDIFSTGSSATINLSGFLFIVTFALFAFNMFDTYM